MDTEKRKRLEAKGWKSVTVAEFLNLSLEEEAVVEIHVALSKLLRDVRAENAEYVDPGTSTDKLLLALLSVGVTLQQIGVTISAVTLPSQASTDEGEVEETLAATG